MNRFATVAMIIFLVAACNEELSPPELKIDVDPVYVGIFEVDPKTKGYEFDFQLTNRGEETLEIKEIIFRGDQNCAFTFEGPDLTRVAENESTFIRGLYDPTVPAEDNLALEVYSNDPDSPFIVAICGKGVPIGTKEADKPSCQVPPENQPECADF